MMYGDYVDHVGTGGWIAMTLMMLVFWVLLGSIAVYAMRSYRATTPRHSAKPRAAEDHDHRPSG